MQLPFTCSKCSQKSVYKALYCQKCEAKFFPDAAGRMQFGKCPECGYSKAEELKKKRKP